MRSGIWFTGTGPEFKALSLKAVCRHIFNADFQMRSSGLPTGSNLLYFAYYVINRRSETTPQLKARYERYELQAPKGRGWRKKKYGDSKTGAQFFNHCPDEPVFPPGMEGGPGFRSRFNHAVGL
jgi:hypothetical protein